MENALNKLPDLPIPHSQPVSELHLHPFPEFTLGNMADYTGRTIMENLEAVRLLTGFPLPFAEKNAENKCILGYLFWSAFIRGGYQGAVYYIDALGAK
jgi:hypothetical protein